MFFRILKSISIFMLFLFSSGISTSLQPPEIEYFNYVVEKSKLFAVYSWLDFTVVQSDSGFVPDSSIFYHFLDGEIRRESISEDKRVYNRGYPTWQHNSEEDLSYYRVHWAFGSQDSMFVTTTTDSFLSPINFYPLWPEDTFYENVYFYVTAFDDFGNQSYKSTTVYRLFTKIPSVQGDVNQDGRVSLLDTEKVLDAFSSSPGSVKWNSYADCDGNGKISLMDYELSIASYGKVL